MKPVRSGFLALTALSTTLFAQSAPQHEGGHDFDFVIGDWKAHVRRLPVSYPVSRSMSSLLQGTSASV